LKPKLKQELAAQLIDRAAIAHRFRAVHLPLLSLRYVQVTRRYGEEEEGCWLAVVGGGDGEGGGGSGGGVRGGRGLTAVAMEWKNTLLSNGLPEEFAFLMTHD
jgi:hypothetical protein